MFCYFCQVLTVVICAYQHRLGSACQAVQDPVTQGVESQVPKLDGELGGHSSIECVVSEQHSDIYFPLIWVEKGTVEC